MDQSAYFEQMRTKRKNEILKAARKLMLNSGPDAFNMQQLARTLDISTVTLYKYYKNSDDIVFALQQNILQELEFTLKKVPSTGTSIEKLLSYLTTVYMVALEHHEQMTLLFLFDIHNRYLDNSSKIENPFFAYDGEFYQTIRTLVEPLTTSSKENTDTMARFLTNLFTAQIRQIALMDDSLWKSQKKILAGQITEFSKIVKNMFET